MRRVCYAKAELVCCDLRRSRVKRCPFHRFSAFCDQTKWIFMASPPKSWAYDRHYTKRPIWMRSVYVYLINLKYILHATLNKCQIYDVISKSAKIRLHCSIRNFIALNKEYDGSSKIHKFSLISSDSQRPYAMIFWCFRNKPRESLNL